METPLKHEDNIDYVRKYNLARTSLRDYWETTKDDSKPDIDITNIEKDDYNSKIKNANNAITKANQTIIKNANHWFLVNTISPEIQENEKKNIDYLNSIIEDQIERIKKSLHNLYHNDIEEDVIEEEEEDD